MMVKGKEKRKFACRTYLPVECSVITGMHVTLECVNTEALGKKQTHSI